MQDMKTTSPSPISGSNAEKAQDASGREDNTVGNPQSGYAIPKVAILGGYGTFHEIAAQFYFDNDQIDILPSGTFSELFRSLSEKEADYGITAIENSVAGSILPNYTLLQEASLPIVGEIYLRISQNLLALPGQRLEDLTEVYSHPMAILQCRPFFEKYPHIKLIDAADTATSARDLSLNNRKGVGAIASIRAAEKYNLNVLQRNIESNKKNYTRFLILRDLNGSGYQNPASEKASVHFALAHAIGSLAKVLSIISYFDINLSKIQSLPIPGKDWEYMFYADLEYKEYERYRQAIDTIQPFVKDFKILGEYRKGKVVSE